MAKYEIKNGVGVTPEEIMHLEASSDFLYMDAINKKCVIRCARAGVFFGIITHKENTVAGVECTVKDCRRIWSWDGAATLSQLAVDGVSKPEECMFTVVVPEMTVMDVIEIIPATDKAIKSLDAVPVWKV